MAPPARLGRPPRRKSSGWRPSPSAFLTRQSLGGLSAVGVVGAGVALGLGLTGSGPAHLGHNPDHGVHARQQRQRHGHADH